MTVEQSPGLSTIHLSSEMHKSSMRQVARNVALDILATWQKIARAGRQTAGVDIMLLHHVFSDEETDFRRLLKHLSQSYTFISYSEAARRIQADEIDGRYLAFSFDDGLKCCLKAASILEEFGAGACFFVCPDVVDGLSCEDSVRFCRERLWHGPAEFMTWQDIDLLCDTGHEIGGHSVGHVNYAELGLQEAQDNLSDCHRRIAGKLGSCDHFAWPYGRFEHFSSSAVEASWTAGFRTCASGERGTHQQAILSKRDPIVFRRQSIQATWPLSHIDYFLSRAYQPGCPWDRNKVA